MTESAMILGLPDLQITDIQPKGGMMRISARYTGAKSCAHSAASDCAKKAGFVDLAATKTGACAIACWRSRFPNRNVYGCGRRSRQPLPGILRCQRASEAFQKAIYQQHLDGIQPQSSGPQKASAPPLSSAISAAASSANSPSGIHPAARSFWASTSTSSPDARATPPPCATRRNHKVYDVVLGRSETALEAYFQRLEGKEHVLLVCMDLSSPYRALVRRFFPNARIVADRFHVIRIINHHFRPVEEHTDWQQEPRSALAHAPASPQPQPRSAGEAQRLLARPSRPGGDLPLQTAITCAPSNRT